MIDKLPMDSKSKEWLMGPIKTTKDNPVATAFEHLYYNRIDYNITPAFAKQVLEKSNKKKATHGNIFKYLEEEEKKETIQINGVRGKAQRRNTV